MPHPTFETLLASDRELIGGWISLGVEPVIETVFGLGYDYVGIDTQHTLIDPAAAARLLYSVPRDGPPALVRAPSNNAPDIGRLLDAGADGVIVPMVNSAADAEAAVAACRYGPKGVRSFGPFRTRLPYDVAGLEARAACFVMIETEEAVGEIAAICATPGLTGIYVGPGDLAVTLGFPVGADPMPEPLKAACAKVADACGRAGLIAAGHFPLAQIPMLRGLGFRMFTVGSDRRYIAAGGKADLEAARASLQVR
jgi:4-hydroxy-2-oxoheptanedioate aldolase